ncbi:MAG TPA: hypothetical protein VKT78_18825 [Fimbriimonadaceae bacterium]|nr:hypothetical protein [Fimbriimonadaceae bacterium]
MAKPYAGQAAVPAAQRRLFLVFFAPDTFAIIYLLELLYRCMRVEPQKWYVTREPIDHRNWHLAGLSKTKRKDKTYVRNNILSAAFSGPRSFQLSDREYSRSVELAYPGVKAACDVTFDEMWTLFLDSGFLYPEKVSRLQPVMREIQNTVRSLLKANGNPMATVVVRNEQALDAQISMLRWYDKTWMVQHLAALPLSARERHASARVTLAMARYGRVRPDIHWGKMFFRPNNAWPSRVFGGFAKRVRDPQKSDLRVFHYLVAVTGDSSPEVPSQVRVRPAAESDFALIENWFTSRGRTVEVMANDLQPSRASLAHLSWGYCRVGLDRHRECIIAERDGRTTGFALLEVSSLGMNFSELTNAFTVFTLEDDPETRLALVLSAKQRYGELGRGQCIALEEGDDLSSFEAAGFVKVKDYACWTFHRDLFGELEEYFIRLFETRRKRAA